jgi:hypothetical protein
MMDSAIRLFTEHRGVFVLEVAYSNLAGTKHYRSSFRVRWDRMQESIVDVEPVETRIDTDPPIADPPDVIPAKVGQLAFREWHSGNISGFPNRYGDGNPSWIAVINEQVAPARKATNVRARLEFLGSSGARRFTVPNADWFYIEHSNSVANEQWQRDVTIEGGQEQSFVFFVQIEGRPWVYKNLGEPIGQLDLDKWRVHITVTSDDAHGFEGDLGFTITRSGLQPNHRAFRLKRTIPALVTKRAGEV